MISLRGLTDHTLKNYYTYIRAYLDYLTSILHKLPEDVSWDELRDYIRWIQKSRNLSDRTINCAISQLRFFTMYVLHKPWDDTQLPMRRFDIYLPYVPSKEETWNFISTMPDLKPQTMVALMYSSGLRIGEVCSLLYEDIQRKNMRIHISHGKNRHDRYAVLSKMADYKIQKIFHFSYEDFLTQKQFVSDVQSKAAHAILNCKSGKFGINFSRCDDCGHISAHNNSCRNRSGPNCQAVSKEIWVDKRRAEVIDTPYFHVVFTLPHELNSLIYCNQTLLYRLLHRCCADTLLELSADKKWLRAAPGIIQVLHTWNQELDYHVHMHCIVSGGGITRDLKLRKSKGKFFIPVFVLRDKFKGKYMDCLKKLYKADSFSFSKSCSHLQDPSGWQTFCNTLYEKDWCPYIKETFNGFGNALEYLGKYTHKIAISNRRILSVDEQNTVFSARGKKPGEARRTITLTNREFIRRYLMHVLPSGFQKIRYYGFLNNRMKSKNLKIIFKLQGYQKFRQRYASMSMAELLKAVWKVDICICPECGHDSMKPLGRSYVPSG